MLALSDVSATLGLLAVFVVVFPALVHVIVAVIAAEIAGERRQNHEYRTRGGSRAS